MGSSDQIGLWQELESAAGGPIGEPLKSILRLVEALPQESRDIVALLIARLAGEPTPAPANPPAVACHRLQVRVSEDVLKDFDRVARKQGLSRSTYLRISLTRVLHEYDSLPRHERQGSCIDKIVALRVDDATHARVVERAAMDHCLVSDVLRAAVARGIYDRYLTAKEDYGGQSPLRYDYWHRRRYDDDDE